MLSPQPPHSETSLEYSGPDANLKVKGSLVHSGLVNLKGSFITEYQIGNKPKETVDIGLEQEFQVRSFFYILRTNLFFFLEVNLITLLALVIEKWKGPSFEERSTSDCNSKHKV